jgi:dTDP-4-amino-4,6-dideoxygalactose transaminase
LAPKNIKVQFHYTPIYEFKKIEIKKISFPGAQEYKSTTLSIPIFYDLKKNQQEKIVLIIKKFLKKKLIKK